MIRLSRSQVQPIGLDIGHDSIKMLQLDVVDGGLSVLAAARLTFPAEVRAAHRLRMPAAEELVRQMLRQAPFIGRRVVAAVPPDLVHVKTLRLPMMPAVELEAAVQFEARNVFAFDIDSAQVHHLPAGEVRQGAEVLQEVIVVAAPNDGITAHIEHLNQCGVIIDSLDIEPCALYRSIERFIRRREDEQEVYVLVDVGLRHSQVVIGKGREVSFFKTIDVGGMKLNEGVARRLSITLDEAQALRRRLAETAVGADRREPVRQAVFDATRSTIEELAREISLCLRYHSVTFRGQRPARVRVLGGEANDPQLLASLNAILPIPAEASRPLCSVDTSRMRPVDRRGTMAEWALAMSLGLKRTAGRFGARDGKPRETARNDPATTHPAETPHAGEHAKREVAHA